MSRFKGALAFAALSLCGFATAQDQTAEFRAFLSGGAAKMKKAFESKDTAFFKNSSTDDFTYKSFGMPAQKKAQAIGGLQQMFGMMKKIEVSFKLVSASAKNGKGTAVLTSVMTTWTNPTPTDKKSHKMVAKSYETESWVKKNGKWMISGIVETKKGTYTMDGKPFDPSKMGGG